MTLSRRSFLTACLGSAGLAACGRSRDPAAASAGPLVDFHVHLFGVGDSGSGCFVSEVQKRNPAYRMLLDLLDLDGERELDAAYVDTLVTQMREASIDKAVLLAQDGRYDAQGLFRNEDTHAYVPNGYLFEVVARHPDLFVPCASINPKRRDAFDELEACAARGARAIKIHPPTQDVDPGAPEFAKFYRRLAELRLLLMVHTGTEHASPIVGHENCDPARLELALDSGCTVIAAHSGFGSFVDREDFFASLVDLVARYPELYCDTAVLGSVLRWRTLPRLLDTEQVLERAVHASDWPFPSNPLVHWNRLHPLELAELLGETNLLERDLRLKQGLGFPRAYFERGARLLYGG